MKKGGIFLSTILILSNISFAKDFTLEEAIDLAIKNDSTVLTLEAEKRQQDNDYKKVEKDTRIWQNKKSYSFETSDEYFLHTGDKLIEAQLKYDSYLQSVENAKNAAEYNLLNTLYNLELAEKNIELLEKNMELQKTQKLVHELKYEQNMITQIDLDNFLLKYNETQNTLDNARNQYELAKEHLKIMLGENEEVNVLLPEMEMKELIIKDIEELISENIGKNKTVLDIKYKYKSLENQYIGLKKGLYTEEYEMMVPNIKLQKKVLGDNCEALKTQVTIVINNISAAYKSYYNNIKSSELEVLTKYNKLRLDKKNMQMIQTRYDAGYIAKLDYEAAKLGIEQSEIDYRKSVINNILLNKEFESFIETGFTK